MSDDSKATSLSAVSVQSQAVEYETEDGLMLRGEAFGDISLPPVLLLHGGGQSRHSWKNTAQVLAKNGFYSVSIDLRGHGDSDWSNEADYRSERFVSDTVLVAESFEHPLVLVGASLGGLLSLIVTGEHRVHNVRALVLVDIAPQMEEKGVERILTFMSAHLDGFDSIDQAADAVAGYLQHRRRPHMLDGLKRTLRLADDGRYYWRWDPALVTSGHMHEARDESRFIKAAAGVTIPVLLLRGLLSDVVSPHLVQQFLKIIPHAQYQEVDQAAHTIAGDSNKLFTGQLLEFLQSLSENNNPARGV